MGALDIDAVPNVSDNWRHKHVLREMCGFDEGKERYIKEAGVRRRRTLIACSTTTIPKRQPVKFCGENSLKIRVRIPKVDRE
jgi:hypothetical protein